ncbi:MAG: hypothetical protein U0840_18440 [Gemmataceae bacterium]
MLPRILLVFTGLLAGALVAVAGLAATGRVQFSPVRPTTEPPTSETPSTEGNAPGRYSIEKVDDVRKVLEGAGKLGFFGGNPLEAWVFKYKGGYVETFLETDVDGKAERGETLPSEWTSLIGQEEGVKEDRAAGFHKEGFIVLTAMPATISINEALANAHFQVSGIFSGGHLGPIHTMIPFFMEVTHRRPYRLFLSAGPQGKNNTGAGFNLWAEHLLPIRGPFIARNLADEEFHVEEGKDLTPGKEVLLLDRRRGSSRIRLKARFLSDGEVRQHFPKQ